MDRLFSVKAGVVAAAALLGATAARADTTLLSLIDPPHQMGTSFVLDFIATAATTTISIGGYEHPGIEYVSDINVTRGGGANLLGLSGTPACPPACPWTFTPAASGSEALQAGTVGSVAALSFAGTTVGAYDAFSRTFSTMPGSDYLLTFEFSNSSGSSISGLRVTTSGRAGIPAVPEPTTWAMMLLGFVGFGLAGFRRARKARPLSCP